MIEISRTLLLSVFEPNPTEINLENFHFQRLYCDCLLFCVVLSFTEYRQLHHSELFINGNSGMVFINGIRLVGKRHPVTECAGATDYGRSRNALHADLYY